MAMPNPAEVGTHHLFDYAPISLWEDDYSAVKAYLDELRAGGVTDLGQLLREQPQVVAEAMRRIRVLRVNRRTLELFEAGSQDELLANLGRIFRDEMSAKFALELEAMWHGALAYTGEGVNYTLGGRPLDIRLHWAILPGAEATYARALVSIEDITGQRAAERAVAASEARFRGLFEHAPISLWEEDYTALKREFDRLRASGVTDLRAHLADNPELIQTCLAGIRVIDVNSKTLELFRAASKAELLANLARVFRDDMGTHFVDELVDMWAGKLTYEREGINYALNGDPLNIQLNWAVMPGAEASFDHVLVTIQDITARKKAEDYLKYLGTHDMGTGLYNRAYYEEELARLKRSRRYPISIIIADLDGLKRANDTRGHAEGDKLIRRAGEVLQASVRGEDLVARIGGDEFAVLLPATEAGAGRNTLDRIRTLVDLNNKFYGTPVLSMSLGVATAQASDDLLETMRQADDAMYTEKRRHHAARP
jgi:diguanylate cyclase (GGDEF)-like protein